MTKSNLLPTASLENSPLRLLCKATALVDGALAASGPQLRCSELTLLATAMVDPIVPSPQTLDLIYGLEAKGLLHRSDDAKAGPRWSLTPDGDTTLRHALHKIEDINDLIAAALPADQRRRFVADLQSILEACAELHEP